MKSRKINHEGEIYRIPNEHVVKKSNMKLFKEKKKGTSSNPRPVMIAIQKSGKRVQISELTKQASYEQISKQQRVRLSKTYPNKNSHADTNTIGKSRKTGKNFVIGKDPLIKPDNKKIHKDDMEEYKKARKRRGR